MNVAREAIAPGNRDGGLRADVLELGLEQAVGALLRAVAGDDGGGDLRDGGVELVGVGGADRHTGERRDAVRADLARRGRAEPDVAAEPGGRDSAAARQHVAR